MESTSYGSQFLQHLQTIGQTTPYSYKDLQQIKTMTQEELAKKLKSEYQPFSEIILANDPKTAAELVNQKAVEMANGAAIGELFGHMLQLLGIT